MVKSQPLYQGRDWFSERRIIVQTYNALDKIYDLCLYQTEGQPTSLFKNHRTLLSLLKRSYDSAYKGLLHSAEELIPSGCYVHNIKKSWLIFELRQIEKEMSTLLSNLSNRNEHDTLQRIMALTLYFKRLLQKLDK